MNTPQNYKIVGGKGTGAYELIAFDNALIDAGIGDYNLVKVSSILPPGCKYTECIDVPKGSILYTAYAVAFVQGNQVKSALVATAEPEDSTLNGVIFEYETDSESTEAAVRDMCCVAMENRKRKIKELNSTSVVVRGNEYNYSCGIAAVVMW